MVESVNKDIKTVIITVPHMLKIKWIQWKIFWNAWTEPIKVKTRTCGVESTFSGINDRLDIAEKKTLVNLNT